LRLAFLAAFFGAAFAAFFFFLAMAQPPLNGVPSRVTRAGLVWKLTTTQVAVNNFFRLTAKKSEVEFGMPGRGDSLPRVVPSDQ
jgi:hypothetical protein